VTRRSDKSASSSSIARTKKFGFKLRPGKPDIFFHEEALVDRYDPPQSGDKVSFVEDLDRKPNKLRAVDVEKL
jgi:cold shock CspA family protein